MWYWLSETIPRHKFNSEYMEHVLFLNLWRRVIIKWLYWLFRKLLFCHVKVVDLKRENINTGYAVTGWMLYVIPHIRGISSIIQMEIIGIRWILLSRPCLLIHLKKSSMKPLIRFGVNILISIVRMVIFTVMNLSGAVKIFIMVIVICGIRNNLYREPNSLVL